MDEPKHLKPFGDVLSEGFSAAWEAGTKAIRNAYDAGKAAGKAEALQELRGKLAGVFEISQLEIVSGNEPRPQQTEQEDERKRARRGSIRPAVIVALRDHPSGITPNEVASYAGINENSARGALKTLADDGLAVKRGDKWFLAEEQEAEA